MFVKHNPSSRIRLRDSLARPLDHILPPPPHATSGEGVFQRFLLTLLWAYLTWAFTRLETLRLRWKAGILPPPRVAPPQRAARKHARRSPCRDWFAALVRQACDGQAPVLPEAEEPQAAPRPLAPAPQPAPTRPAQGVTWARPQPKPRRILRARFWEDPGWAG